MSDVCQGASLLGVPCTSLGSLPPQCSRHPHSLCSLDSTSTSGARRWQRRRDRALEAAVAPARRRSSIGSRSRRRRIRQPRRYKAEAKAEAKAAANGCSRQRPNAAIPTKAPMISSGAVVSMPNNRPTICTADGENCVGISDPRALGCRRLRLPSQYGGDLAATPELRRERPPRAYRRRRQIHERLELCINLRFRGLV